MNRKLSAEISASVAAKRFYGTDFLFCDLKKGEEFRFPGSDVVFVASSRGWYRRKGDCSYSFRTGRLTAVCKIGGAQ